MAVGRGGSQNDGTACRWQTLRRDGHSICVAILNSRGQVVEHMDRDSKSKNGPLRSLASAVDLVHLRSAVAVPDHGSFRRAAEALLLRQSTLSRSARQLEERIEMIVFERSSGGVRATQASRDFLRMLRSIPERMDTLVASAHSTGRGEAGRLAIGFYTSLSAGNLGATLIDYACRFPRVDRSVACRRACEAATRRFSSAPEVERQGAVTSAPLHRQLDGMVHRNIHRVST
jgi:Bacterial regulatory helix-turn-helix protein, lysR family